MRILKNIAGTVLALYLIVLSGIYLFQRDLQYIPSTDQVTAAEAGLENVQEGALSTPDGEKLINWYAPAAADMPTILYFHGNAGGLIGRAKRMARYQALGFGFFIHAYRGFAGSTGTPSEEALIADARLAYAHLLQQGVKPENIAIFGESLGTSLATQLAASVKSGVLILDSPFTAAVDVGALRYPYLPVHYLMQDQFHSDQYITKVKAPVLVVHGGKDRVVPLNMGRKMFELANEPKEFILIPETGHSNHDQFGLVPKVQAFIAKHISAK